jgi:hypothetical protein
MIRKEAEPVHWTVWIMLPLPLLSLATLVFALTRRDADPRQRARMATLSGVALALGALAVALAAAR